MRTSLIAWRLSLAVVFAFIGLVGALALGNISPSQMPVFQPQVANAQSVCPAPLNIVNGGFESPNGGGGVDYFTPAQTGWDTTDSNGVIEVWGPGNPRNYPAYEGSQFAEINAFSAGTLSQTLDTSTLGGQELSWSFAHRAREGTDTMALLIGAPGALIEIGQFSATTGAWVFNQGSYTVPDGQAQTTFAYRAISTGSGSAGAGNLIDAVSFGVPACAPAMTLEKTGDALPGEPLVLDQEVTYTFEVENTGNIDLTNVTVADPLPGLSPITPASVPVLAIGETATFTATYLVSQEDVDAGVLENTATASADSPEGYTGPPPTATDTLVLPPDQVPGLSIEKTSNVEDGVAPELDDIITYTFEVENTGNVTLTDVTVNDPRPGLSPIDPPSVETLAPNETATFTATYQVTQTDVDNGLVANFATATGTPPPGCVDCEPPVSPPDEVTILIPAEPGMTFEKVASTTDPVAADDVITYTFEVENTGNVTLEDVTITDSLPGLSWVTGPNLGDLAPGGTATGEATYTVTADDVAAGGVTNAASADCAVSCLPEPPTDEITVPGADPGMTIVKSADPIGGVVADDTITYTFTVENTGNVVLEDVTITDTLAGLSWVTGPDLGDIAVGESAVGEATYVVTQDDVDNGGVTNVASADCAVSCLAVPPTSEIEVPTDQVPGLSIVKEADTAGPVSAGEVITYTFTVENTGTVTLSDVTISDELLGLEWVTGPNIGSLAPGAIATGEATYTVTATDVADGGVANSATVTGTPPDGGGDPPVSPPSDITIPGADPGLAIVKESDTAGPVSAGDVITYTFTVTNTGNVPLADVTISDALAGLEWVTGPELGTLEPGAVATGSATYTVTNDDVLNGSVVNSATVTGTPPDGAGDPPVSPPGGVEVPTGPIPDPGALTVEKSADAVGEVHPGDLITFTFVVTNTGGTPVENVTVVDELPGLGPVEGPHGTTLGAGESATFTATYPVTESDAIAGEIVNTATVSGTGVDGSTVTGEDTVNLEACDPVASDTPTETPGPGTPEADDDADAESQFGAAATCTGIVEPNPDPTEPPSDPDPTNPPSNGGGNNGGGNNGGGNSGGGGGGGPVTQLPSTGQSGQADASVLGSPLLVALLIALVALFGVALRLQVRRSR